VPVLRFARDRRGYESTYLVEAVRKGGHESGALLYWFRTPPHVKIGRAAFDEDAIRLLEQQHPEIDFDWDRILTARPPAAPESRDAPGGRVDRRGPREGRREDGRGRDGARIERRQRPAVAAPALPPATPPAAPVVASEPVALAPLVPPAPPEPTQEPPAPVRRFVRVFDRTSDPDTTHHATDPSAAERHLGPEQLTILRARHAEILARITSRGGDPVRLEALREQAERVNPDTWVTDEDVAAGMAAVDGVLADLHRQVGRRRRRRRRGGGARRPDTPSVTGTSATPADPLDAAEPEASAGDLDDDGDGPDE
jgi:hypothetical protein